MNVGDFYSAIDRLAPFAAAADWDNVGLLAGDPAREVSKVVLCLDVTEYEIGLAVRHGAELIISHHPLIFRPLKRLEKGSLCWRIAEKDLSVISAHTNLDKAKDGVNDTLCNILGLRYHKAGENVADGFLNVGTLPRSCEADAYAGELARRLSAQVRFLPGPGAVRKIAVCAGAGGEFYREAAALGCDALVTGDADYHDFLCAGELGVRLFAAGHFETEHMIASKLKAKLENVLPGAEYIVSDRKAPIATVS